MELNIIVLFEELDNRQATINDALIVSTDMDVGVFKNLIGGVNASDPHNLSTLHTVVPNSIHGSSYNSGRVVYMNVFAAAVPATLRFTPLQRTQVGPSLTFRCHQFPRLECL